MNRGGVHGCGNVHELQAKRASGEREIADVANQRNVGVVDGHVQIGLVVQAGGLIGDRAARFFFLSDGSFFVTARWIGHQGARSENYGC